MGFYIPPDGSFASGPHWGSSPRSPYNFVLRAHHALCHTFWPPLLFAFRRPAPVNSLILFSRPISSLIRCCHMIVFMHRNESKFFHEFLDISSQLTSCLFYSFYIRISILNSGADERIAVIFIKYSALFHQNDNNDINSLTSVTTTDWTFRVISRSCRGFCADESDIFHEFHTTNLCSDRVSYKLTACQNRILRKRSCYL